MASTPRATSQDACRHILFVYEDDDEFVDRASSYFSSVGEDGEAGVAILTQSRWAKLTDALGDSSRVAFVQRSAVYERPGTTVAYYHELVRRLEREGAPVVRVIADMPVWRRPAQRAAWLCYEAILNHAFAEHPVSLLCAYDLRKQPENILHGAWRTHPTVLADAWEDNHRYEDPARVLAGLSPAPEPLSGLRELPLDADQSAATECLERELKALRVPKARAEKLLRAAAGLLENARAHGGGARSQRLGRIAGHVVWELSDNGPGFDDPFAGYLPPRPGETNGTGLWSVRQLADRLEFLRGPQGFTARIWA
jgi:anti-sigma regulatory factor (Ser/Thr protein kinase)